MWLELVYWLKVLLQLRVFLAAVVVGTACLVAAGIVGTACLVAAGALSKQTTTATANVVVDSILQTLRH